MDFAQLIALAKSHAWLALAVLVVGFLVRLTAKDSKVPVFRYINIPDQWQPVVVLALGTLADVLQEVTAGKPWDQAINASLVIGVVVLAAKAYFHGNEPSWLKFLAMVVPQPPPTKVAGPAMVLIPDNTTATIDAKAVPEDAEAPKLVVSDHPATLVEKDPEAS